MAKSCDKCVQCVPKETGIYYHCVFWNKTIYAPRNDEGCVEGYSEKQNDEYKTRQMYRELGVMR